MSTFITDRPNSYRYAMFGSLYFVQGVINAFTTNFFKPYLDSYGIDPDRIALLSSLLLLPFIVKIFYGMLSDRINFWGWGHRLPYIRLALILSAAGIMIAGLVDPASQYTLLAFMILLASFAVALFDTTADALAVEITPVEDQGTVQSIMTSGRAIGIVVMSILIGIIATTLGYTWAFATIAVLMLVPYVWVWPVSEPPRHTLAEPFEWGAFRELLRPPYPLFALYGVVAWTTYQGIEGLITFYLSADLGGSEFQIGTYGSLKGIGMVGGALLVALLIQRLGRATTAYLILGLVSLGGLVFSFATTPTMVLVLAVFWGVILGLHWTMYMVLAMNMVDARIAGSMFAISMAISNIGSAVGEFAAPSLVDDIGFVGVLRLLAAVNLIAFPILWRLFRKMTPTRA